MNYYKHHIGDYDSATAHLSWGEDMAYTRLLRLYYRREGPLPVDFKQICRLIRAGKKEEPFVQVVLEEFFILEDDGWYNSRADEEISQSQSRSEKNREVGQKGGRPRKPKTQKCTESGETGNPEITQTVLENNPNGFHDETQTVLENNPSHKPLAISHKPIPSVTGRDKGATSRPDEFSMAADWEPTGSFWALAKRASMSPESPDFGNSLTEFIAFWRGNPGESRTQSRWEKTFLESWKRHRAMATSAPPAKPNGRAKPISAHSGFAERDYTQGINPDGSF